MNAPGGMGCRICGNADGNTAYDVREMMFGTREIFRYFRCAACGCLQIAEVPADLSAYYPPDYCSFKPSLFRPSFSVRRLWPTRTRNPSACSAVRAFSVTTGSSAPVIFLT